MYKYVFNYIVLYTIMHTVDMAIFHTSCVE